MHITQIFSPIKLILDIIMYFDISARLTPQNTFIICHHMIYVITNFPFTYNSNSFNVSDLSLYDASSLNLRANLNSRGTRVIKRKKLLQDLTKEETKRKSINSLSRVYRNIQVIGRRNKNYIS